MKRPRVRGSSDTAAPKTRTTNSWLSVGRGVVSIERATLWPNNRICQQCQLRSQLGLIPIPRSSFLSTSLPARGAKTTSMRKLFQGS